MMSGSISGKGKSPGKLFKDLFKGRELKALPFFPLAQKFAAKVGQVDPQLMWADPAAMVNSLLTAKELCGFDTLTTNIDFTGCEANNALQKQERAGVALEVTQRLKHMLGDGTVLGCMAEGPFTLSGGLSSSGVWEGAKSFIEARDYLLQQVKLMGESRIDYFILHEDGLNIPENALTEYLEQTRPIWNALRYYDVQPILALKGSPPHIIDTFAPDVSGIAIMDNIFELDLGWLSRIAEQKRICIGLSLPEAVFTGSLDILETILTRIAEHFNRRRIFLLPSGEIPAETEVSNIQDCMKKLE